MMKVTRALAVTVLLCCLHRCLLDKSQQLPSCGDGRNEESCSWSHVSAEQKSGSFSFNQCVGLNYDNDWFFDQVITTHSPP
jgi:hypothetical protein